MAANASRDEAVLPGRAESGGQRAERRTRPLYPFLAAPFQALGIIRWAQLFYGVLACLGLFIGARRWLGRFGGFAAVGLYCSSGAALLFAWREYMPTFTGASLIAAGSGDPAVVSAGNRGQYAPAYLGRPRRVRGATRPMRATVR